MNTIPARHCDRSHSHGSPRPGPQAQRPMFSPQKPEIAVRGLRLRRLLCFPLGPRARLRPLLGGFDIQPGPRLRGPGPVFAKRVERGDPLAGERRDLLLEPRLVVGDELGAVARATHLDLEHLPVSKVRTVRLDRRDRPTHGAALEGVHGGGPGRSMWRSCGLPVFISSVRPSSSRKVIRPSWTAVTSALWLFTSPSPASLRVQRMRSPARSSIRSRARLSGRAPIRLTGYSPSASAVVTPRSSVQRRRWTSPQVRSSSSPSGDRRGLHPAGRAPGGGKPSRELSPVRSGAPDRTAARAWTGERCPA